MNKKQNGDSEASARTIAAHPQLFRSPADWESEPKAQKHGHHLRRAWDEFGLNAVLCVEGKPTVYFKQVQRCDLAAEADLQRRLWNQGTATMLVVEDSQEVRVYSALAKPSQNPIDTNSDSDRRLVEKFTHATFALELTQFIRRVETGQIYRERPLCFQTQFGVDQYLLEQLNAASTLLCSGKNKLRREIAHALLGRFLFTCYLLDRKIIDSRHLKLAGAKAAKNLLDLLKVPKNKRVAVLFQLFQLLQNDFNGSMFGDDLIKERKLLNARHIEILERFSRGDNLVTGQQALFCLYDFSLIPIETISAIYENFLAAEGETKQRAVGAYYTPPRLAELVIDVATEGWNTLLDKRCLDPSCGSGVFLVILFTRMAEEWRLKNPNARNTTRARKLMELLTSNLCGVDVNPTACRIACFSLYLAFLDQLSPRDILDLKDELDREKNGKVLPPLLVDSNDRTQAAQSVIYTANFFGTELPDLGQFDLVIGNPPWFGRNQPAEKQMEDWLFSNRNPFLAEAPKSKAERKARFLPSDQSAIAFMWKTPLHLKSDGKVCLLLPSKVLLGNQTDAFQGAWFSQFKVETIWQLADYSFILFEGADCPAIIVRYNLSVPDLTNAEIPYIAPKVERVDPRRAEVPVLPDDQKVIPLNEVLLAAHEDRAFTVWKKHFWGTTRDQRLINRLLKMPALNTHAGEPSEKKRFVKGQGFQPGTKSTTNPKKPFWRENDLYIEARSDALNLLLLPSDCEKIGKRFPILHRPRHPEIYRPPLVLINQGCDKFTFADFPVYFRHSLQAIAGSKKDENLLLFLTAVLNSPLTSYFLFHTSANWGVERDKVHFEELLQLPFPFPEQTRKPELSRAIVEKVANRLRQTKAKLEAAKDDVFFISTRAQEIQSAKSEVVELVNEYFELCEWEKALVQETIKIFEPSSTPHSSDSAIRQLDSSTHDERTIYANTICQTINGWARRSAWRLSASCQIASRIGVGLLTLSKKREIATYGECPVDNGFEKVLQRMQKATQKQHGRISYLRGFAMFEGDCVHILKPLSLRHWTKTAALNDADTLVGYMIDVGGIK